MKQFLFICLILLAFDSYSQKITRGPDIGEIYFIGPVYEGNGLYYSTDFGETAVCVDSIKDLHNIVADKLQGCIYGMEITPGLYFSNDFGNTGSWVYKSSGMYPKLCSGVIEGYIYNKIESHSEDYGSNFIIHAANGFFGSLKTSEIDNQVGTGYAVTKSSYIPDSIFFLVSYDNFENLIIKQVYHDHDYLFNYLTRGTNNGEIFTVRNRPYSFDPFEIYHSNNYGDNFSLMNELNITNYYSYDVEGGRVDGELYMLYNFVSMAWQNAHTYIFHSTNYGKTFEVFHPFAKGNEPELANFSSDTTEGEMPFTVDFCNFSIGDIQTYEWDFNNDGTIDSYEQSPIWIYQDTGYYSVKLKVIGPDSSNTFLKENYIYVYKTVGIEKHLQVEINCYPNPFNNHITFEFHSNEIEGDIFIYNNTGQLINAILKPQGVKKLSWDRMDKNGNKCKPGIYFVRIENNSFSKKILLIK